MQGVNKFAIGAAVGDQPKNNHQLRTGSHLVTPPVRSVSTLPRSSQVSKPERPRNDASQLTGSRMSYIPDRPFRAIRDDQRDDAMSVSRTDGMAEWNRGHQVARNEPGSSAFAAVAYRVEHQRALVQRQTDRLSWYPEREWRRPVSGHVHRPRLDRSHTESTSWSSADTNSPIVTYRSATWKSGLHTVAQINEHHQLQMASSGRGAHPGAPRDVQAISMSSSNGSSTGSCRSPNISNSMVGEKRLSDAMASEPMFSPRPDSAKRLKPSPVATSSSPVASHRPQAEVLAPAPPSGRFDMLDLLCSATLEVGPLMDNPSGCSCPKSKCVALYCDCFKAGRRCAPGTCSCLNCKNTIAESGVDGARTKAIRTILARNPRAFTTAGIGNTGPPKDLPPGQVACNCIRSRCLKLYCGCFQVGKECNANTCTCIGCLNREDDPTGQRRAAIQNCLEKKPNAFKEKKEREPGMGCACKNNRCIRKYCECFRGGLTCTEKCVCRECENQKN